MTEPDPRRDIGPYDGPDAALKQYAVTGYGMPPWANEQLCGLVIREAMSGAGAAASEFELDYLNTFMREHHDPILAQLIQGWIIRAHIAGVDRGRNKF